MIKRLFSLMAAAAVLIAVARSVTAYYDGQPTSRLATQDVIESEQLVIDMREISVIHREIIVLDAARHLQNVMDILSRRREGEISL